MNYDLKALAQAYQEISDLDFELRVHALLKAQGCISDHGGRYLDHITQKMREYDIRARLPGKTLDGGMGTSAGFYDLEAVIECKNISADYPLIIGARKYEMEEMRALALKRDHKVEVTGHHAEIPITRMPAFVYHFGQEFIEYVGVEAQQVAAPGKPQKFDRSGYYDKWSQAVSHAVVRYTAMIEAIAKGSANGEMHIWCPAILVVPDDRLFLAIRSDSGIDIRPICGISVKVGYEFDVEWLKGSRAVISNYFVFSVSGLERFLKMFKK